MNENVFREYDIRGVVESDFPDSFVYDLGRAYATFLIENQENKRFHDPLTLEKTLFLDDRLRLDPPVIYKVKKYLEFYTKFPFYSKGSGKAYVQNLLEDILRIQPFDGSIQLVESFKKSMKESSRID